MLYNLLRGGFATHFNCHVVSLRNEGTIGPQIKALGVPVTALDISERSWFSAFIELVRVVKTFKPDIIQGWMYHGNLAATLACAFAPNKPVLAWNIRHSLYDLRYEKTMTRQVIRANSFFSYAPDVILYNSRFSRKQHEDFGFVSHKGRVIPNGVDTRRFIFSALARQRIRAELGIPPHALVIGHVARLHPMKDHPLFLKSAVHLARQYADLHFILCGRGVEPKQNALVGLVPTKFANRFHLLGERSDIAALMSAMDVFCLSSWSEAFPNVLCEAMAIGLLCVATDVGDSSDIVGDTGVVVPPRTPEAFAGGLRKLIEMEPSQKQLLGRAARKRIEENFSLSTMVKRYAEVYEEIVNSSKLKV